MKKSLLFIAFSVIVLFSVCSYGSIAANAKITAAPIGKGYLSICQTQYTNGKDEKDGFTTNIYSYDLATRQSKKIFSFPYTTEYPLGVYSKTKNKIYFSSNKDHGDQLFSYDLSTKKTKQLSTGVFAINYIVPMKNNLAVVARKQGIDEEKVAFYNEKKNNLDFLDTDNDFFADVLTYNPFIDTFAVSFFSKKERDKATDDFNSGKVKRFIPANYHVYTYNENYKTSQKLFSTKHMIINNMALNNSGNLFFKESDTLPNIPGMPPNFFTYIFNSKKKAFMPAKDFPSDMYVYLYSGGVSYNYNNSQIFFEGCKLNDETYSSEGIYLYDFNTKKLQLIFKTNMKIGAINNFMLFND